MGGRRTAYLYPHDVTWGSPTNGRRLVCQRAPLPSLHAGIACSPGLHPGLRARGLSAFYMASSCGLGSSGAWELDSKGKCPKGKSPWNCIAFCDGLWKSQSVIFAMMSCAEIVLWFHPGSREDTPSLNGGLARI